MHALVRTIFARLHSLDPELEEAKLQINEEDPQEGEIKLTVTGSSVLSDAPPDGREDEENITTKSSGEAEISAIDEKEAIPNEVALQEEPLAAASKPECESTRPLEIRYRINVCRWSACNH